MGAVGMLRIAAGVLAGAMVIGAAPTASASVVAGADTWQGGLDSLVAAGATSAIAELRQDGRTVWRGGAGVSELGSGRPVAEQGRFRIGSVTKPFVATIVLQLVGEGRLALSDTVEQHLPGLLPGGAGVTVRRLLNHTSGLADFTKHPDLAFTDEESIRRWVAEGRWDGYQPRELAALAAAMPVRFQPGERWEYSNTNYVIASMLVEQVTGHRWEQEVRDRIVRPLGLQHTDFPRDSARISGPHAHAYFDLPEGPADVTEFNPSAVGAAGSGLSTTADLNRFQSALLGGELLRPAEQAELLRTETVRPGVGYGLGLQRMDSPCGPLWGHTGSTKGFQTAMVGTADGRRQVSVSYVPYDHTKGAVQQKALMGLLVGSLCA
ncbi:MULTISPECIES: serine hydrolase [unclassified Kitasatospora]|uniref:serine hydrolase domain-containing protein n=1 Tax=unclassified Kitasatospora TaxID=2633591 RepID=UPI0009E72F6C|nr:MULTISPECIES: serine hydrolase domain-containing protein [unclassified Kitasatospora]